MCIYNVTKVIENDETIFVMRNLSQRRESSTKLAH